MRAKEQAPAPAGTQAAGRPAPPPPGPNGTALAAAVRQYETPLLRYVGHLLRDHPDEAQDVVQDSFLKLRAALATGAPPANLSSWLYRVAHNLAMDHYRRQRRNVELEDDTVDSAAALLGDGPAPPPAAALERREACGLAAAELAKLPVEQRQVLVLKVLEGLTLREVAEITGESIATVHYRLQHGLRALARRLKEQGAV